MNSASLMVRAALGRRLDIGRVAKRSWRPLVWSMAAATPALVPAITVDDGQHGRGEEVDVADPGREAGAVGDAAEHLAEQHQHGHGHGQGEHEQLRDAGAGAQVAAHEDGELVQGDGPLAEGARKGRSCPGSCGGEVEEHVVEAGRRDVEVGDLDRFWRRSRRRAGRPLSASASVNETRHAVRDRRVRSHRVGGAAR